MQVENVGHWERPTRLLNSWNGY